MNINISKLHAENFKGFKEEDIKFGSGKNVVSGANATGKTTVVDAVQHLITGKNSKGEEKFQIRPVDASGNTVHNVDIVVEGELAVENGSEFKIMTLKKTIKEKWVKRRGTDVTELQGNETVYEIDGYPRTEREYRERVNDLIDEKTFRILTNPKCFPTMPPKEQREILFSLVMPKTDAELARDMGGKFLQIADELENATTDDILAKQKKSLAELKKKQSEIPVRIDEASRTPDVSVPALEQEKRGLVERLSQIHVVDVMGSLNELYALKSLNETELSVAVKRFQSEQEAKKMQSMSDVRKAQNSLDALSDEYSKIAREIDATDASIKELNGRLAKHNHELDELASRQMDESKLSCPVCRRRYSAKKIEEMKTSFYEEVNKQMVFVNGLISADKAGLKETMAHMEELRVPLVKIETEIGVAEEALRQRKAEYQAPVDVDFTQTPEYISFHEKAKEIHKKIADLESVRDEQEELESEIAEIEARIVEIENSIEAYNEAVSQSAARVEALKAEQRDVGQKASNCEKQLAIVEEFIREKMNLLSEEINGKFDGVEWKLFEMQINGGMRETCECTINGVPYNSANNGHQIIAGLNIIKTLQTIYGVKAPIFIDNAESVNEYNFPEMDCQMIFLKVTDDIELKVEEV